MNKENSSKTTLIAIGAAIFIAIVGVGMAVYAITLDSGKDEPAAHSKDTAASHAHESDHKKATASSASAEQASVVIVYGNNGFEQAIYTVKSGETVLVKNESNVDFYFTTGDHHNHDIHSPLSLGTIASGASSSFVAPAAGVYGFHNHDDEHQAGELIVQ